MKVVPIVQANPAAIILGILVVRAVLWAISESNKRGGNGGAGELTSPTARRNPGETSQGSVEFNPSTPVQLAMIAVRTVLVLVSLVFLVTGSLEASDWLVRLACQCIGVGLLVPCFPTLILDNVLIPLGLSRSAWFTARLLIPLGVSGERLAGAIWFGARALCRQDNPDIRVVDQWDSQLRARAIGVGPVAICAAGLLADLRNDRVSARVFLMELNERPWRPMRGLRSLQGTGTDWLVADAAARGDWASVLRWGGRGGKATRWGKLLGAVAARLLGQPHSPSNANLWMRWAIAPGRRRNLSLLRRALAVPRGVSPRAPQLPEKPPILALIEQISSPRSPRPVAMCQLADQAEQWLVDPALRAHLERRGLGLGARAGADAAIDQLRVDLQPLLGVLVGRMGSLPHPDDLPAPLVAARQQRIDELYEQIEGRLRDINQRCENLQALLPLEEWRVWAELRDCLNALLLLHPDAAPSLAAKLWPVLLNFGVWLYNERNEKLLASSLWKWELELNDPLGMEARTTLLRKNLRVAGEL